ncbi:beta strand repeat-containing protein [Bartonella schoenbuchensis]|uniref:beta strand repeat-containing protein n=1 Tax=Bartonella schoenbuchensis TaxID=165694 RepID=UPI0031456C4F
MVMRRVFNHHVCFCVLSTAILAGLALMTSQTKVYAAQNCKGLAGSGDGDQGNGLIVCDGKGPDGTGAGGVLSGRRDIDMGKHPRDEAAVTITGASTKIRISSELKVTNSRGSSNNMAIKVSGQGKLTVDDATVTGVQKGIVVEGPSSSVTIVQGTIGVRAQGGGSLIEVSNNGEVVLMKDVKVGTISGNKEVILIDGGGDVMLMGTRFDNVKTGIVVRGRTGTATVRGGATITLQGSGSKGLKMEGTASANVGNVTIMGSGGKGTGAEVSSGTLTLNMVQLKQLETGAKVTNGTLEILGKSTINVAAGGTGVKVLSGTANVTSTTITLQGNGGKGLNVTNGKVKMMGGSITGKGSETTGVEMGGSADVTLTSVTMKDVKAGITMEGQDGVLTLNGTTKIQVVSGGTGLEVKGSGTVTMMSGEITAGGSGKGVVISGRATANVTLTNVKMEQVGTGITMEGEGMLTLNGGTKITGSGRSGVGINVTGGSGNVMLTGVTISEFTTGVEMGSSGTLTLDGSSTITVGHSGTGLKVTNGTVTMTGGAIKGGGTGTTGVQMSGGEVMLEKVNISEFTTGITMTGGESLTVDGGSIRGNGSRGVGIDVTGGSGNVRVDGVNISGFTTGINMTGTGGTLKLEGTTITVAAGGKGVEVGTSVKSTTLTNVTIEGSGERGVEVKGGAVVMDRVGITLQGSGTGVEMGAGVTSAELTDVQITGVERGVYAGGSGELKVEGGEIQFKGSESYDYGVNVGSSVTRATLTGVTITGSRGSGKGVWLKGGAVVMNAVGISQVETGILMEKGVQNATLTGVKITGVDKGIMMEAGESLTVSGNSTIQFTGTYGVYVGHEVKNTELTGVTISGDGKGYGVLMTGTGNATLTRVNVSKVERGIAMSGNGTLIGVNISQVKKGVYLGSGTLTINGGTIEFKEDYGVAIERGATANLTNVTIRGKGGSGNGYGVLMTGSTGNATLTRVNVSQVEMGIFAVGGVLMVSGGEIKEVEKGITMMGGTLTVRDNTKIGFTKDYGIKLGKSVSKAELTGVTIAGSNRGKGVVWESAGTLKLEKVEISGVGEGMEVKSGSLTVDGGSIGFMRAYGVMVGGTVAKAELTKVEIRGSGRGKTGVLMGSTGTLTRVNISGVQTGVEVAGSGKLTMEEGKIEFTGTHGVMVEGGTAELKGTKIVGSGNNGMGTIRGIYVGNGSLTLTGVGISEVQMGIKMMGNGVLKVKEGTTIEFMAGGTGVMVGNSVTANLTGVEIKGKGSGYGVEMRGKTMMMNNVTLKDVETGVEVSKGDLTVVGGTITGVKEGIKMMEGGRLTVKDRTRIEFTGGGYGVLVGGMTSARLTGAVITGRGDGYGVYVTGGRSLTVTLGGVNISNVGMGVWVGGGESLTINGDSTVKFTKAYGVYVGYKVKSAELTGVTISGENKGIGVYAEGEKMMMTKVNISQVQTGVYAEGGAMWLKETTFTNVKSGMTISEGSVFMFKGGITFKGEYGIYLSKGHALLSDFDITGSGGTSKTTATGIGVVVSSLGEVMMRGVNISEVATGAYVTGYGLLVMDKGSITFKGKHGINLVRGYALLNGVNIKGPSDKKSTGIELGYGQVLIKGTTFTNVDKAITVTQGDVKMEGGEIEFKGEHGILLNQGGVALMGVTMRYKGNSTTADFIKITGEDTTNAVEAVDPKTKNTFTPKSAVVVAASLKIDGSGHGQALNVTNGGRVVLMNPTYTDVYTGMTITKGAVRMLGGEITFNGNHGILLNQGHALLTNVTMEYKGHEQNTTFLKVEAENVLNTADIIGTGIKIDGKGYGQGVHVTKGGRVKLKNAVFSDVVKGMSVVNGEFWMKGGEITFKGDYGVSLSTGKVLLKRVIMKYKGNNRGAKGTNTASPNFIKVDGRGANLAAIKVMITGNGKGNVQGVKVSNGGHVTLKQSHVPIQPTIHIIHNFIL